MDWAKVLESLTASGPLALVLGGGCYALWGALQAERAARAKDAQEAAQKLEEVNEQRVADLKAIVAK